MTLLRYVVSWHSKRYLGTHPADHGNCSSTEMRGVVVNEEYRGLPGESMREEPTGGMDEGVGVVEADMNTPGIGKVYRVP